MKRRYGSFLIPRQLIETDEAKVEQEIAYCDAKREAERLGEAEPVA